MARNPILMYNLPAKHRPSLASVRTDRWAQKKATGSLILFVQQRNGQRAALKLKDGIVVHDLHFDAAIAELKRRGVV